MIYPIQNLIEGVFIKEHKTRFLCEVSVNENNVTCYVPISCKISKLIELNNNSVLLSRTQDKHAKTKYSLFAIKANKEYIVINTGIINKVVGKYIENNVPKGVIKPEFIINNYKSDFFIEKNKVIVEVKSIISREKNVVLPNMVSKRSIEQLKNIYHLLQKEYLAEYYFVCLTQNIKLITVNIDSDYGQELKKCIDIGMKTKILKILFANNNIILNETEENKIYFSETHSY